MTMRSERVGRDEREHALSRAVRRACGVLGWGVGGPVVVRGFGARLRGIRALPATSSDVLVLPRCASVHTWFLPATIDVAFVDAAGSVLAVHREVRPYRVLGCRGAAHVLERWTPGGMRAKRKQSKQGICLDCEKSMVVREGVEPPTRGFSVLCSTN